MNQPENPSAFPTEDEAYIFGVKEKIFEPGMTLRDYFAGQALITLMSISSPIAPSGIAFSAYQYADAMLEQRVK